MTNTEQLLINFDKTKENIPRQITNITPVRDVWGMTQRYTLSEQVKRREIQAYRTPEGRFDIDGIIGEIKEQEDASKVAAIIARYKYTIQNHYLSDIAAGLYTMLTTSQGLYDVTEIGTRDNTGKFTPTGARIICSLSTLYKAAFGSLVNRNGNAINGTGSIIHEAKKQIMPIINGEIPMPRAYASIHKKQKGGTIKNIAAVIEGEPIRVYRKLSGAKDALIIDLDYYFFPCSFTNDIFNTKKGEPFIHRVAGQTVFMQLGSMLENKDKKKSQITIDTAIKILTAVQAAFELSYFVKGIVKENNAGRINISMRRKIIPNIYPAAIDNSTGYVRWKKFSDAVSLTGKYFNRAMEFTGIKNELLKIRDAQGRNLILIPAIEKGAEFPEQYLNTVYLKVDRLK